MFRERKFWLGLILGAVFVMLVNPLIRILLLGSYLWASSGVIVHIASVMSITLLVAAHRRFFRVVRENRKERRVGQTPVVPWSSIFLTTLSWFLVSSCLFAYYGRYCLDNDTEVRMFIEMYRRECYPFWD